VGSLNGRIQRLEDASRHSAQNASRAALGALSDEELDDLEDTLEAAAGEGSFEDLYAATTERGRWALDAYTRALEAVERGDVCKKPESKKGAE
jgi:hypothetical protein